MALHNCNVHGPPVRLMMIIGMSGPDISAAGSAAGIIFCVSAKHHAFNITVLARTPADALSAFLRPPGQNPALSLPGTAKIRPDNF